MGSEHLGRRELLTAAGVGVVAAAGLTGTASAATPAAADEHRSGDHHRGVSGGWLVNRSDEGASETVRTVLTFADGGVFLALDIDPSSPPLAGSWKSEGRHGFAATFWGAVTDPQDPSVSGTVRVKATGHADGDHIYGSYRYRVSSGGQTETGTGSFRGRRIDAD